MEEWLNRTEMLLGKDALARLAAARVAVFGIGGVGGYAVEALARSGIGALDLIDGDRVSPTNLNRQIVALRSTIGEYKADVAARRIADINPDAQVRVHRLFFDRDTADSFDFSVYDYVVDAIDTVSGKIELVLCAQKAGVPIICSMGTGNKLNPAAFEAADLAKTSVCPLARAMRVQLRRRGIVHLKVVYSKEEPIRPGGRVPGSVSFAPPVAGMILAGEVIRDLIGVGSGAIVPKIRPGDGSAEG